MTLENKGNSVQRTAKKKFEAAKVIRKTVNPKNLEDWIASQRFSINATVHINGPSNEAAILTVDFGAPITNGVKMSSEQVNELTDLMKRTAGEFYSDNAGIRVSFDPSNGIYWASLI